MCPFYPRCFSQETWSHRLKPISLSLLPLCKEEIRVRATTMGRPGESVVPVCGQGVDP